MSKPRVRYNPVTQRYFIPSDLGPLSVASLAGWPSSKAIENAYTNLFLGRDQQEATQPTVNYKPIATPGPPMPYALEPWIPYPHKADGKNLTIEDEVIPIRQDICN